MNELNFARFDAKLEQSAAELSARIDRMAADLSAKLDQFAANVDRQIAALALSIERGQVIQLRWMIGMWVAVLMAVIGFGVRR